MKTKLLPIALLFALAMPTSAVLALPVNGCVLDDPGDPFSPQTCTYVEPANLSPLAVPSQAPAVEDGYVPIFDAPGVVNNYLVVNTFQGFTTFTLYSNSSLPNFGIPNFGSLIRLDAYGPAPSHTLLTDNDLILTKDVQYPSLESVRFYLDESLAGVTIYDSHYVYSNYEEPLPEPATLALFSVGLAGLGGALRRARKI